MLWAVGLRGGPRALSFGGSRASFIRFARRRRERCRVRGGGVGLTRRSSVSVCRLSMVSSCQYGRIDFILLFLVVR